MRWKISCITLILITFFSFSLSQTSAEETKNLDTSKQTSAPSSKTALEEPENLDEPTPWKEGDPDPIEKTVPAVELEQTSDKAPPSRPIDDERPKQTSPDQAWVSGYWWWTSGSYFWVPGYWALPPHTDYVFVPGYWRYRGRVWIYVRGGWAKPGTTVISVYARPRPLRKSFIFLSPARIARRHPNWRHHHARRIRHRSVHSKQQRKHMKLKRHKKKHRRR